MVRALAYCVVAIALAFAHGSALAQPASATRPAKTVQRLAPPLGCESLTVQDGLPHSHIYAIAQDQRGFIWFGTKEGLARYDGLRLVTYRTTPDPTSISWNAIYDLAVDDDGKLWVATEKGLNRYDPNTDSFTRFMKDGSKSGISSEGVSAIARDAKGTMWFAMSDGGLNQFDPATSAFIEHTTKPLEHLITALTADRDGNLWAATSYGTVIRWNPTTDDSHTWDPDALGIDTEVAASSILVSSTGHVWVGLDGEGLRVIDPKTKAVTKYRHSASDPGTLSNDQVKVIFEDRDKQIWVGTFEGLNRFDEKRQVVRFVRDLNDPKSLSFNGVESLFQDAGGVMWAGGFTVGVCKFSEQFQAFGHYFIRNLVTAFLVEKDGTLWVGTYNAGLLKYERSAQRLTVYHELRNRQDGQPGSVSLENQSWVTELHKDRSGTLWMSFDGRGLIAFNPETETYREYTPDPENPESVPIARINDIWEDSSGIMWLATWGAGLVRFDPKAETFATYAAPSDPPSPGSITSAHLYTLHPDPADKNVLWIGTAAGGVVRFNVDTRTATSFRHKADSPTTIGHDDVISLYLESKDVVWVGTYGGGLSRLDVPSGKAERFTTASSGLTNDSILGILPANDGTLWLSTDGGGLVTFHPKEKVWSNYTVADGLQDNEFNQNAYYRAESGELFFGGARGFNAFFPDKIVRDTYVPPIVVTGLKIFNQDVKTSRPIWTLPKVEVSYTDSFEIQFAALAYAAPERNRYAYKLEGFDDKFIETDRPFAQYAKLSGGKYTLRVRASNRHGVWNEKTVELKIAVAPPWWRTWQAFVGYLVLLALAVYMLFRYQRERVRRAEREGRLAVVERDLELSGAVQTGFLPEMSEIATERVQVHGFYRPADACGGDWWWHEPLMGGRHIVMVGDVTGHGPGPAMVTAAVATAFRVLIENGLDDPEQALHMLNREVLRVAKGKYHMTMAALELNETNGRWVLYNAGAPPIMSLNAQGKHRVHFCPGAPLGTEHGFEIGRVEGQLQPTERILIYTDGIPEIILPNGNVLGMRRFAQLYEKTRSQSLREVVATILANADQTRGGEPQLDDWTFTILQWG